MEPRPNQSDADDGFIEVASRPRFVSGNPTITIGAIGTILNVSAHRALCAERRKVRVRVRANWQTGVVRITELGDDDLGGFMLSISQHFARALANETKARGFAWRKYPATIVDGVLTFTLDRVGAE